MGFTNTMQGRTWQRPQNKQSYAPSTVNKSTNPIKLSANEAVAIENFIFNNEGDLETIKGTKNIKELSGSLIPTFGKYIENNISIVSYHNGTDTIVAKFNIDDKTITTIKTFSGTTEEFNGDVYDEYLFGGNGKEPIGITHSTGGFIDYSTQTGDFIAGLTITGSTSGATATIYAQKDNGTSGTIVIKDVVGVFVIGEIITDTGTGSATLSTAEYEWYTIQDAPVAKELLVYKPALGDSFLVCGNTHHNKSLVRWSKAHLVSILSTGAIGDIPFTTWSGASSPPDPADPGEKIFGEVGEVKKLIRSADSIVVGGTRGTTIAKIDVLSTGVKLAQEIVIKDQDENMPMLRGISTPQGVFFSNERGMYRMILQGGQKQEQKITSLLGEKEIEKYSLTDTAFLYDGESRLYIFFGRNSSTNNYGLCYHTESGRITEIKQYTVRDAFVVDRKFYGIDSRKMAIYELFAGNAIDGQKIRMRILFPMIGQNDLMNLFDLKYLRILATLGNTMVLNIDIHTWNRNWKYISPTGRKKLEWISSSTSNAFGVGATGVGTPKSSPTDDIQRDNLSYSLVSALKIVKYQVELTANSFSTITLKAIHSIEEGTNQFARGNPLTKI